MTQSVADPVEWWRPTGSRFLGLLGVSLAALVLVLAALDHAQSYALPVACGAVFTGVLIWAAMLRPRVGATGSTLVLRNMLDTVRIPLAGIEELALRQVLAVRVGEKRYVSPALGRSWRALARGEGRAGKERASDLSYADIVEDQLRSLVDTARSQAGLRRGSPEQLALAADVRREPAWPEISLLLVSVLGLIASLVR